jgi:hypothetical protein
MRFRCHDLTVPYPTATFSLFDPFEQHELTGIKVKTDERHIVTSWSMPEKDLSDRTADDGEMITREVGDIDDVGSVRTVDRKRPALPPFFLLPLPYPFSYVSGPPLV